MAGTSYKGAEIEDVDHFLKGGGVDSEREKTIGQHIGYRYDVNLVPDYDRITDFLKGYIEFMVGMISTGSKMCIWVMMTARLLCLTATSMAGWLSLKTWNFQTISRTGTWLPAKC